MSELKDPRFLGAVKMLERTGAREFRVGYSPEEDGEPVVWYAVATWGVQRRSEASAAMGPLEALMRLCAQVIDGGTCNHCGQSTIFDPDSEFEDNVLTEILDSMGCRYAWDPELSTFRRSCEGSTP